MKRLMIWLIRAYQQGISPLKKPFFTLRGAVKDAIIGFVDTY